MNNSSIAEILATTQIMYNRTFDWTKITDSGRNANSTSPEILFS